jgi:hypothetical protein
MDEQLRWLVRRLEPEDQCDTAPEIHRHAWR